MLPIHSRFVTLAELNLAGLTRRSLDEKQHVCASVGRFTIPAKDGNN